jgi:sugar-specific transcriptional regulator TrmB
MNLTTLQKREVSEVFRNLGLKNNEQDVYLTLLASGPNTITPLGRILRIPPTTVQAILNRLEEFGIIAITLKKSRHIYEALEPMALKKILEEKIKEVTAILPILEQINKDGKVSKAKIKVYYRDRMTDIFNEALEAKSKLVYEIVSARDIQAILGEKFHFTKNRVKQNVKLKSLRVESGEIKKYNQAKNLTELREAKFLPRELTFTANFMFWDNKVVIFSSRDEGIAVLMESRTIKEAFLQLFELLWSVSRKMEIT